MAAPFPRCRVLRVCRSLVRVAARFRRCPARRVLRSVERVGRVAPPFRRLSPRASLTPRVAWLAPRPPLRPLAWFSRLPVRHLLRRRLRALPPVVRMRLARLLLLLPCLLVWSSRLPVWHRRRLRLLRLVWLSLLRV
ncbi:hypothetical protein ACQI4L_22080 [Mycolicibacterium litorale]|uniref:hypothetical protein n=1 Tax=Mycolicibacterium litorale TaxID=758802 RepID=UPI003CECC1CA